MLLFEPFELLGAICEGLFLGGAVRGASDDEHEHRASDRRRRRRAEVRDLLRTVAERFPGSRARKPWFRAPRLEGYHDGRAFTLIWRGPGRFELRCPARASVELIVRRANWLQRLFQRDVQVRGTHRGALGDTGLALYGRFGLESLKFRQGELVAVGYPRAEVHTLQRLVAHLVELAWAPDAPQVRVSVTAAAPTTGAAPLGSGVRVKAESALRCPFCHDGLRDDAPVVHCASCDAPHHPSCFEEGNGCSIQGCRERRAHGRRAPA